MALASTRQLRLQGQVSVHAYRTDGVTRSEGRKGANGIGGEIGVGGGNGNGNGVGGWNVDVNGDGNGDEAGVGTGTEAETNMPFSTKTHTVGGKGRGGGGAYRLCRQLTSYMPKGMHSI